MHEPTSTTTTAKKAAPLREGRRSTNARPRRGDGGSAKVPATTSLAKLERAAKGCLVCPHAKDATQTVFGAGPRDAPIVLVGEQPGNQEDLSGAPFVGPAGRLLRELMSRASLDPNEVYLTNAVKHFMWEPRGKRRLHLRPHQLAIRNCRPWLEAELRALAPKVIVCLGSVAAQSFFGPKFKMTERLGEWLEQPFAPKLLVTYHPSAILRMPTHEQRDEARTRLVDDLKRARRASAARTRDREARA